MLPLATNYFTFQAFLSKGNGTDAIVTVYEDASVKEARENRDSVTLGSWAAYLSVADMAIAFYSALHYEGNKKKDSQRTMGD